MTSPNAAKERAETLGKMVRASGHYPLLGGGDINLYSLVIERAMELVKPDGRFKFCALIFGGEERRFGGIRCALDVKQ